MDYVWNKTRETISKKPTYMNNMTSTYYFGVLSVVPYALMETAYGTIFPSGPY